MPSLFINLCTEQNIITFYVFYLYMCIPVSFSCMSYFLPPTIIYLPYRVIGTKVTAVGRSQLLARWPGTLPDFIWDLTSSADCFKRQEARDDRVLWWQWHQLDHRPYANNLHLSRPITTPTRHHSIFTGRMLFLTSIQQCQSSEGSYVSIIPLQKLE